MREYDNLFTFADVDKGLPPIASNPDVACVVFSNGTKDMVTASVQQSDALKTYGSMFSDIVTVDLVRTFKPAPEVYKYLASRTASITGDDGKLWLISSNPFDVVGARATGMEAIWVDRAGEGWQDQLGRGPSAIVRGIDEVAAVVGLK
jgi:2-haloacid dehalogenase